MTEADAKSKWCPMKRLSAGYGHPAAINFFCGDPNMYDTAAWKNTKCIGSECMMWRWEVDMINVSTETHDVYMRPSGKKSEHGYCGLAGK